MGMRWLACGLLWGAWLTAVSVAAQSATRPGYDIDFIGPPLADPVLQHAKETYVLYGCAYCHGVNLVPRGEAADLRQSAIVARDVNANVIGPLLRAGIPQTAKLSPMPQFSDLSEQQINALALWIHYARSEARYADLTAGSPASGDAAAGQQLFATACASCHSVQGDLAGVGRKYDAAALRARILKPPVVDAPVSYALADRANTRLAAARQQHRALLEHYTADEVANVTTYLQNPR
jgi:mono/diheme cytochrome c family protein